VRELAPLFPAAQTLVLREETAIEEKRWQAAAPYTRRAFSPSLRLETNVLALLYRRVLAKIFVIPVGEVRAVMAAAAFFAC
jgi:hypothetical protein